MDPEIYLFPCGRNLLSCLYHLTLVELHTKQLEIWEKSNELSQGLNNKIKVLKRVSFGLHRFDAFRRRILLTCGRLRLSQDPFSILENAKFGKEIGL